MHVWKHINLCVLTHCVPHIDIALATPVIALREGLPIREHIAFLNVSTLSKAIVVQPGCPVVHVARMYLSISCSEKRRREWSKIWSYLKLEKQAAQMLSGGYNPFSYILVVLQPASVFFWFSLTTLVCFFSSNRRFQQNIFEKLTVRCAVLSRPTCNSGFRYL